MRGGIYRVGAVAARPRRSDRGARPDRRLAHESGGVLRAHGRCARTSSFRVGRSSTATCSASTTAPLIPRWAWRRVGSASSSTSSCARTRGRAREPVRARRARRASDVRFRPSARRARAAEERGRAAAHPRAPEAARAAAGPERAPALPAVAARRGATGRARSHAHLGALPYLRMTDRTGGQEAREQCRTADAHQHPPERLLGVQVSEQLVGRRRPQRDRRSRRGRR